MKHTRYTYRWLLAMFACILLAISVPTTPTNAAGTLKIGQECKADADCTTNECEESTVKKPGSTDENKKFCVCDVAEQCSTQYGGATGDWACKNGADATYDLNYCLREKNKVPQNTENIKAPIGFKDASFIDAILDPGAAGAATINEIKAVVEAPQPRINIPGLTFTDPASIKPSKENGDEFFYIPFLGQYIAAVYRYAVAAASIIAVVMLIIAGIQWMGPGNVIISGSGDQKEATNQAKKRIAGAITGLILAVGSYTLLYTINPELVQFRSLRLQTIKGIPLEVEDIEQPLAERSKTPITGLLGPPPPELAKCSKELAKHTADLLHKSNVCVGPCHCAYSASKFMNYIGCTSNYHGSATWLPLTMEGSNWETIAVTSENYKDLPIGILYKSGHVGISLGDGKFWDSGSTISRLNRGRPEDQKCPTKVWDAMRITQETGVDPCAFCSKVPGEGPSTGRFGSRSLIRKNGLECTGSCGRGGSTCETNQAWSVRDMKCSGNSCNWLAVVTPHGSSQAKGCCIGYKDKANRISSEVLCNVRGGNWNGNITDSATCKAGGDTSVDITEG